MAVILNRLENNRLEIESRDTPEKGRSCFLMEDYKMFTILSCFPRWMVYNRKQEGCVTNGIDSTAKAPEPGYHQIYCHVHDAAEPYCKCIRAVWFYLV